MDHLLPTILILVLITVRITSGHNEHEHFHPRAGHAEDLVSKQLREDREHLKEDIEKYLKFNPQMIDHATSEELEYFYFVLHDFDKNDKLDGSEILKAIAHLNEHHPGVLNTDMESISQSMDDLHKRDDADDDGYLSYPEYITAKNKALKDLGL